MSRSVKVAKVGGDVTPVGDLEKKAGVIPNCNSALNII